MQKKDELTKMIDRCSRCGACQAHCPLYQETGFEPYVARGKVELLELLAANKIQWTDKMAEIFSTCLLCGSCGDNCPNKVEVDRLVRRGRRDLVTVRGVPIIKRTVFEHLLKKNGRLSLMAKLLWLYQHTGLQMLVRKLGLLRILPGDLAVKEKLLPRLSFKEFRKSAKLNTDEAAHKPRKLRAAYYTGCMTNYIYPQTGFSVLKILQNQGVEVIIPSQGCCGIPALAGGDYDTARELARRNVDSFTGVSCDYIITDCASCLGTWLEYPELLGGRKAPALAAKIMDISTFLVEVLNYRVNQTQDLGIVTYHDPCHLKRIKGGRENPRALLRQLGGKSRFAELNVDRCCGSAGSFNISHYRLSQKVVVPKVDAVKEMKADYLVTSCPACMMQLEHAVIREGLDTRVMHIAELLARATSS